jgi:F0F1-type ATP synthase membrane subunit b/b'
MLNSTAWRRREVVLLLLAVVGWAGFLGTLAGQLSIQDRLEKGRQRVEDAESQLDHVRSQVLAAQEQSDEMFKMSQQLSQEREQIIKALREKVADLELRLKKYEP